MFDKRMFVFNKLKYLYSNKDIKGFSFGHDFFKDFPDKELPKFYQDGLFISCDLFKEKTKSLYSNFELEHYNLFWLRIIKDYYNTKEIGT